MSPTVHELRNAIRVATGRFERAVAASFTKEELRAICEGLGVDIDEADQPSTSQMRRLVRAQVGIAASVEAADDSTVRKAELQRVAEELGAAPDS